MPRTHSRRWPLPALFVALLLLPLLLLGTPEANLRLAQAEEAEEDDEDEDEADPGPDLGESKVPFPEQVNRALDLGVLWLRCRPEIFEIPGTEKMKGAHWGPIQASGFYGGAGANAEGKKPRPGTPAGPTALALYALLKCGVSPKERVVTYGFNWLRSLHKVTQKYDTWAFPKTDAAATAFNEGKDVPEDQLKERYWTHTVAGSSYELSAMILALTAKYDQYKKSARTRSAREKGKLKIKNKEDRLWLQQLVTGLIERRGQPAGEALKIDASIMKRFADPSKEQELPGPTEMALPPREERLGWRYNKLKLNLVKVRSKGKKKSTENAERNAGIPPHANQDVSSTQLAALALYAAQQFGMKFSAQVWIDIAEFTLSHQEEQGPAHERHDPILAGSGRKPTIDSARGFVYMKGSPVEHESRATGSMTGCGIANLLMAREAIQLTKEGRKLWEKAGGLEAKIEKGIWDGLAWLDKNWSPFTNPKGNYHIYYLYSIERTQDLRGKRLVGKHLWYPEGAVEILKRQQRAKVKDPTKRGASEKDGVFWNTNATHGPKDVLDTCFALLFLKRATRGMAVTPADSGAPRDGR